MASTTMKQADERAWASYAHLLILLGLLIPFANQVVPPLVYLRFRREPAAELRRVRRTAGVPRMNRPREPRAPATPPPRRLVVGISGSSEGCHCNNWPSGPTSRPPPSTRSRSRGWSRPSPRCSSWLAR